MSVKARLKKLEKRIRPAQRPEQEPVDVSKLTDGELAFLQELESRMMPDGGDKPDLSKLTTDELRELERIAVKLNGPVEESHRSPHPRAHDAFDL